MEKNEPRSQFEDFDFVLMLLIRLGEPSVLHYVRIKGRKKNTNHEGTKIFIYFLRKSIKMGLTSSAFS